MAILSLVVVGIEITFVCWIAKSTTHTCVPLFREMPLERWARVVREVANKDVRRGPNGVTFSICRHVPSPSLYLRSSLVLSPVSPASALAFYCQLPPFFKGCNGESGEGRGRKEGDEKRALCAYGGSHAKIASSRQLKERARALSSSYIWLCMHKWMRARA